MMGVTRPGNIAGCSSDDPQLRAEWTVWENGRPLPDKHTLQLSRECVGKFVDRHIFKFLGMFGAEVGNKYLVEVRFTKDGSALNVANPHLIVVRYSRR